MPPHDTLVHPTPLAETPLAPPALANGERRWLRAGAAGGLGAVALILLDLVLTMLPGWGSDTVPTTAGGWLQQFATRPALGLRNLDLLNMCVSVVGLPLYLALAWVCRRAAPVAAAAAAVTSVIGTTLFVASNAALPMLELSRRVVVEAAGGAAAEGAAEALLARGAHGSFGVYPAFLVSGIGSLLTAVAMLATATFSRRLARTGLLGSGLLLGYVSAITVSPGATWLITVLAMPGGLLMLGWTAVMAQRLWRLSALVLPAGSAVTSPAVSS